MSERDYNDIIIVLCDVRIYSLYRLLPVPSLFRLLFCLKVTYENCTRDFCPARKVIIIIILNTIITIVFNELIFILKYYFGRAFLSILRISYCPHKNITQYYMVHTIME